MSFILAWLSAFLNNLVISEILIWTPLFFVLRKDVVDKPVITEIFFATSPFFYVCSPFFPVCVVLSCLN